MAMLTLFNGSVGASITYENITTVTVGGLPLTFFNEFTTVKD